MSDYPPVAGSIPGPLQHQGQGGWVPGASAQQAPATPAQAMHGQAGGATAGPIGRDVLVETMKRDPSRRTDRFKKMASR